MCRGAGGRGSSASSLLWFGVMQPVKELGCAATIFTIATWPISVAGPGAWTGCSQGVRPDSWPGLRPGPVNSTGTSRPAVRSLNAVCWARSSAWSRLQPVVLAGLVHLAGRAGGGGAGTRRVFEAERLGEADPLDQRQGGAEIRLGLARMAHDEVAGQRHVRPRGAQPLDQRADTRRRCGRGSSRAASGPSRTAPADAGTASAPPPRRCAAIRLSLMSRGCEVV